MKIKRHNAISWGELKSKSIVNQKEFKKKTNKNKFYLQWYRANYFIAFGQAIGKSGWHFQIVLRFRHFGRKSHFGMVGKGQQKVCYQGNVGENS